MATFQPTPAMVVQTLPNEQPGYKRREVLDGIMFNTRVIRLPYRWPSYVYPGLDTLRRTPGMRTRILPVPYDYSTVIGSQLTHIEQVRAKPNSWMWALRFVVYGVGAATDFAITITETGGYPLSSSPIRASQFVPGATTPLFYLPKPWKMETGLATVEITNLASANRQCQLAIVVQEESHLESQRGGVNYLDQNPAGTYGIAPGRTPESLRWKDPGIKVDANGGVIYDPGL